MDKLTYNLHSFLHFKLFLKPSSSSRSHKDTSISARYTTETKCQRPVILWWKRTNLYPPRRRPENLVLVSDTIISNGLDNKRTENTLKSRRLLLSFSLSFSNVSRCNHAVKRTTSPDTIPFGRQIRGNSAVKYRDTYKTACADRRMVHVKSGGWSYLCKRRFPWEHRRRAFAYISGILWTLRWHSGDVFAALPLRAVLFFSCAPTRLRRGFTLIPPFYFISLFSPFLLPAASRLLVSFTEPLLMRWLSLSFSRDTLPPPPS